MNCLYLNAHSIMNKLDDLVATVCVLRPDIVGITETWASERVDDAELMIAGYDMFRCDRPSSFRGGGVLLYVREELNAIGYETKSKFPEQIWCKIFDRKGRRF